VNCTPSCCHDGRASCMKHCEANESNAANLPTCCTRCRHNMLFGPPRLQCSCCGCTTCLACAAPSSNDRRSGRCTGTLGDMSSRAAYRFGCECCSLSGLACMPLDFVCACNICGTLDRCERLELTCTPV
jgi:hypothetical protein